jgi:hypothetical protein
VIPTWSVSRMFEFGVTVRPGIMSRVCDRAVASAAMAAALFFVSVNQVLLRLWTRVIDIDRWGNPRIGRGPAVRPIVLTGFVVSRLHASHSG